jgi:RNA polymerase sigma-70 factor (ECF subfamily)
MDLEEAYDRYAAQLYRHALAITRSGPDAEDAVQTAFLKLASRSRSRAAIADMESYLHVAVRRESVRLVERRRGAGSGPGLDPGLESGPDPHLVAPSDGLPLEDVEALNRALAALPEEQREVVLLHNYEGMAFRRIGEVLGIPADTAASRHRYAIAKLKERLDGR